MAKVNGAKVYSTAKKYANKDTLKVLFWVLAAILLLVFGSKIIRLIKTLLSDRKGESEQITLDSIEELSNTINWSALPQSETAYQSIADGQFNHMEYSGTEDFDGMLAAVSDLTAWELKAVYVKYRTRVLHVFGIPQDPMDLMGCYAAELSSWSFWGPTQQDQMNAVWEKAGLRIS